MRRPGLTLIEAAVAMGVVAILAVPAAGMWLSAAKSTQASERNVNALILAQLIMESKVRVVPYVDQVAASGTDADTGYTYVLTLTTVAPTLRRADVTVTIPGDAVPLVRLSALSAKEL